jgi:hypothetical protein
LRFFHHVLQINSRLVQIILKAIGVEKPLGSKAIGVVSSFFTLCANLSIMKTRPLIRPDP